MGIKALLPFLEKVTHSVHMSQFSGMTLAVDGFTWMYKAAYSCSEELYHNPATPKILNFCVKRIKSLQALGIKLFFVFDGRPLPAKYETNEGRRQIKENASNHIQQALKSRSPGDITNYYNQAISIKFETVQTVLNYLRSQQIPFVVAPYEADAQLTFLVNNGIAQGVLTEDSDMIAHFSPITLLKLNDQMYADCIRIDEVLQELQMSRDEFLTFCILCGCDYTPHIRMVGPKTAYELVKQYQTIGQILRVLRSSPRYGVPSEYEKYFRRAFITFKHQMVYNMFTKTLTPLEPINEFPEYIGPMIPNDVLQKHVMGLIDPNHEGINENQQGTIIGQTMLQESGNGVYLSPRLT
ncbi:XPG I-region family protein [Histomonas meleagridis]|uniref:XPG I-region family protein n=1 Tax=Histomonas meleagridis TaxID=135588 RepID=UPI00355A8E25|nr:XPG I-region family protein [Histomonas meleagridis]KAH0796544.1 XPG I-region family protein [Histomonas meleagridis]